MNTTQAGDEFELEVFNILSRDLEQGNLWFNPKYSKIYRKKSYFSSKRNKKIVFDICIESYAPNQETCSIRTIIECKNLSRPVEAAEIEEFYSKVTQVADLNVKGVFVSSSSFQETALNFAKASGIALIRILPGSNLTWILTRAFSGPLTNGHEANIAETVYRALTDQSYLHDYINCFGTINGQFTHSLWQVFSSLLSSIPSGPFFAGAEFSTPNRNFVHVEFIEERNIAMLCRPILQELEFFGYETPINDIVALLKQRGEIEINYRESLGRDISGNEIQGGISFNPTIIYISNHATTNMYSQKFTLAHELGHYFLKHDRYILREFLSIRGNERWTPDESHPEDIKRLEWQANRFASHLLLPRDKLQKVFFDITCELDIRDRGHGALFVDNQRDNLRNFYSVLGHIRNKFKVSDKAIEIALKSMRLINDQRPVPERVKTPLAKVLSNINSGYSIR